MMDYCSVFHNAECSLGEGLLVDNVRRRLFWVDIDGGQIFQKNFDGREFRSHEVGGQPSALLSLRDADILIADSFTGCVNLYAVDVENCAVRLQRLWHDFRPMDVVPDGGCADGRGNVYFALWDGAGIAVLNHSGSLKQVLSLPVLRPTNCKLADDGTLFVTSARAGMTDTQLNKYPLSGSVLALDLTEVGNGYAG